MVSVTTDGSAIKPNNWLSLGILYSGLRTFVGTKYPIRSTYVRYYRRCKNVRYRLGWDRRG